MKILKQSVLLLLGIGFLYCGAYAVYYGILNSLGPSTEYYEPAIIGAQLHQDGKYYASLGDRIIVTYIVVRHSINGSCPLMKIYRYAENIGGPSSGKRHLLDYAELQFRGKNELFRPRWPLEGLVLGYDIYHKPLLDDDVKSQEFALYVVGQYFCNALDYIFPRYLQGGIKPNETERVNLVVTRPQ